MRRGTLAGIMIWLAFAATTAAAPLPHDSPLYNAGGESIVNENPDVTADYQGTMTEKVVAPEVESSQSSHFITATLKWDESVSGPVDQIEYTGIYGASSLHWKINELTGTVEDMRTQGKTTTSCTGTFSPTTSDAGTGGVSVPLEEPGHPASGGNPATNPDYSVTRTIPVNFVTSAASGNEEYCNTSWWNGTGDGSWGFPVAFASAEPAVLAEWAKVTVPTVYFPPGGDHVAQAVPINYGCKGPSCGPGTGTGAVSIKVDSSITFSSPPLQGQAGKQQAPPAPAKPCVAGHTATCEDKEFALFDLVQRAHGMSAECAFATLSAAELGKSFASGATNATEAQAVLDLLTEIAGPDCVLEILTLIQDAKIIDDPPIGGLNKLAQPVQLRKPAVKLRSCRGLSGTASVTCRRLRADELHYVGAVRSGEAVAAALLTTVNRISGAARTHRAAALKLQTRHAAALRRQFKSARALQRSAGRAIATLLRSRGITVSLTAAQDQRGIAKAFSRLARGGLPTARFGQLSGQTLTGAPTDVLAALSQ